MRFAAAILLLTVGAAAGVSPEIRYFRYQRPIENLPAAAQQACVAIDPAIFAHAAPQLADLRVYQGSAEAPYAINDAAPATGAEQRAELLNLGERDGQVTFDAAMPEGSYGDVELDVGARNFIATVAVTGSATQAAGARTKLGSFTIFDFTRQRLGRSTLLHLPKSDFRYLHFRVAGPVQPENVKGLTVLKVAAREARYVTVAATTQVAQKGRESIIEFAVPANVPVDRVTFVPGAQPANFSRDVRIHIAGEAPKRAAGSEGPPLPVEMWGNVLRVHRVEAGHAIDEEQLSVETPAAVPEGPTHWVVSVENGDDAPLQLRSVRLEMIERDLCFNAAAGSAYALYYGDPALAAPRYDYASLFALQADAARANAGPEARNPLYEPRPDTRPFTERHPALLWVALIATIVLLGGVALRTAQRGPGTPES